MSDFFSFQKNKKDARRGVPAWKSAVKPGARQRGKDQKNAFRPESIMSRARSNTSLLQSIRKEQVQARRTYRPPEKERSKKSRNFSFSLPLIPVLGVLFAASALIIHNQDKIASLAYQDVVPVNPGEDPGGQLNLINYAGSLPPEIPERPGEPAPEGVPKEAPEEAVSGGEMPLKAVEYFSWIPHTVQRGESVSSIAAAYGLTIDAVIASNNLTNAHVVKMGQNIRLPNMNGIPYTAKEGDTLAKISKNWSIPLEILVDVNDIQEDVVVPGQNIFLPGARMPVRDFKMAMGTFFADPLKGMGARQSSSFGWRKDPFTGVQRLHGAIDWAVPQGTPVKAAAAGKVTMVGFDSGYGRYIILNHSDNFETLYAHLSVFSVKQGDTVVQGAKIGEAGNTGRSTGPHLHFALYKNRRAVNPLDYLSL